ncbi:MAG: hypothetical protein QUV20_11865 [Oceanibaculum nanhaiense]|uniref:hypothetical protein n=1 Tax=Oceanibaculum nanhaiense TaxID=1909734 RepID=UPI0025A4A506|nr:hypothetical protein [Oceanibaculum nanhaiense]MDM7947018.1 hypothetical protein [Oceanibaculum nanhaiense]
MEDDDLQQELRTVLTGCARRGETIAYLELAHAAGMQPPHLVHRVTEALEEMLRADHAAGRPLLAALATRKDGLMPGRGFFWLLNEMGRYDGPPEGEEAIAHYRALLEEAIAYWSADSAGGHAG